MVKTICILAGIRGGGGHPDPDIKGGSGLKNIFLIIFD